jgi:hypothetical protein
VAFARNLGHRASEKRLVRIGAVAITLPGRHIPQLTASAPTLSIPRLFMITFRSLLLAAVALAAPLQAASAQSALANPGFEDGAPSLTGWHFRQQAAFSFALDSADAREGRWAARMTGQGGAAPGAFGNLLQRVDAAPYRGRQVRYRAWVRTELEAGPSWAGLWLRVDRSGGVIGFFDNMDARPITGRTGWTQYEITGEVAPDAVNLYLGVLLVGTGQVWVDAASLEADPSVAAPEAARPLTEHVVTRAPARP